MTGEPVGGRHGSAESTPFADGEDRTPKVVVEIDQQAGGRGGDGGDTLEELLDVGGEIEGFRDDDYVEGFPQVEELARLAEKGALGDARAGEGDLCIGKVDTGFSAGGEQGEEFAVAAADLQDGGAGGDEQVVIVGEQPPVAAAGGRGGSGASVEVGADGIKVFSGEATERRNHECFVGVEPKADEQLVNEPRGLLTLPIG